MAKNTSMRTLKSFFSRSEVNLDKSAEKDTNDDDKSKFRLLKFKKRTKSEPYLAKAAHESQQILSCGCFRSSELMFVVVGGDVLLKRPFTKLSVLTAGDDDDGSALTLKPPAGRPASRDVSPENDPDDRTTPKADAAKDGKSLDDLIGAGKKSPTYGTASRSKGKEFSYSEMDLRKPKRFPSISSKKKKKNDPADISQSTIGLHRSGIAKQEETPPNPRQRKTDQANTKVPQPDPEAIDVLDVPPPPAKKQSESYFSLPKPPQPPSAVDAQPAQGKDLSYSEMDLRKPKKFATFSFVSRKKKKNDRVDISQSTIDLHGSGIAKQEEGVSTLRPQL
ncbi:hypothetical protein EYF80_037450 [Liparis tanakae]|uniref:Uncharacterized protein n=1 Tax=Liparis tanakae TaxID=230148 RepID=A0A4Z2GFS3_9TELE|nr:hypothetical protein EYF80_037450 [Liparis tanakae]